MAKNAKEAKIVDLIRELRSSKKLERIPFDYPAAQRWSPCESTEEENQLVVTTLEALVQLMEQGLVKHLSPQSKQNILKQLQNTVNLLTKLGSLDDKAITTQHHGLYAYLNEVNQQIRFQGLYLKPLEFGVHETIAEVDNLKADLKKTGADHNNLIDNIKKKTKEEFAEIKKVNDESKKILEEINNLRVASNELRSEESSIELSKRANERADSLETGAWIWLGVAAAAFVVMIYISFQIVKSVECIYKDICPVSAAQPILSEEENSGTNSSNKDKTINANSISIQASPSPDELHNNFWELIAIRSFILIPLYILITYALRQYGRERILYEEYKHKAAIAGSLPVYIEMSDGDQALRSQIIKMATEVVYTVPSSKEDTIKDIERINKIINKSDK